MSSHILCCRGKRGRAGSGRRQRSGESSRVTEENESALCHWNNNDYSSRESQVWRSGSVSGVIVSSFFAANRLPLVLVGSCWRCGADLLLVLSRATISAGLQELAAGPEDDDAAGLLRGTGAGRKALAEHDAGLVAALERLVDPATRGDPTGPLRWTCSSAARLSRELQEAGHRVSERSGEPAAARVGLQPASEP